MDITKLSAELFKVGQKEYKRRCEEHDDFISVFEAAKKTGAEQSRRFDLLPVDSISSVYFDKLKIYYFLFLSLLFIYTYNI